MNKGALALLVRGSTENWSPERWKSRFAAVCGDRRVALLPDEAIDPEEVAYAAVWKPAPGVLAAFPNLRVIFNLGAGVDALIADPSLPKVPVVRVAIDDLTGRMTEYVVLHVLMHGIASAGSAGSRRRSGRRARSGSGSWGSACSASMPR